MAEKLLLCLALVVGLMIGSQETSRPTAKERIFEVKVPAQVAIELRIRPEKEESFKDLKNAKWLSEFELEVKNTGEKPIYFLLLHMGLNVKAESGREIVYPLWYARSALEEIDTKATDDDVPIKPGESVYLSVSNARLWELGVSESRWPQSTKFTADFQRLSFGDGTGYVGSTPYPPAQRK